MISSKQQKATARVKGEEKMRGLQIPMQIRRERRESCLQRSKEEEEEEEEGTGQEEENKMKKRTTGHQSNLLLLSVGRRLEMQIFGTLTTK